MMAHLSTEQIHVELQCVLQMTPLYIMESSMHWQWQPEANQA